MKRTLAVASIIAATGFTAATGLRVASAESSSGGSSLVDKIASTFNLSKDDVQKVFDEDRASHQAEHQAKFKEQLDQAVKDGKLTQEQADKILAKQQELESFMNDLRDETEEERKTAMDTKRTELAQWAKDNDIPEEYAHFMHGPGGPGEHGGPHNDQDNH